MTIIENLEIPMKYAASGRLEHGHLRDQAMEFLEIVGLQDRADENSANLTQIDMRRLELARALSAKPSLLLSMKPWRVCRVPKSTRFSICFLL